MLCNYCIQSKAAAPFPEGGVAVFVVFDNLQSLQVANCATSMAFVFRCGQVDLPETNPESQLLAS